MSPSRRRAIGAVRGLASRALARVPLPRSTLVSRCVRTPRVPLRAHPSCGLTSRVLLPRSTLVSRYVRTPRVPLR